MKFVSIKSSGYHLDSNLDHDEQVLVKIGYWIAQDYERLVRYIILRCWEVGTYSAHSGLHC